MKKILFISLVVISGLIKAQSPIQHITKNYFRDHPFDGRFSSFILNLQKDPWFTVETYNRRNDTTFFFLTGVYNKNFNPFRYQPAELRLVVAEEEMIHKDSLQTRDTIINLQLMGITNNGSANQNLVEKEFKRFHNNELKRFSDNTYKKFEANGLVTAEIENFFIDPFSVAPVTIAWGALPETNQYTFTITIRFKLKENIADLIVSPDDLVIRMDY